MDAAVHRPSKKQRELLSFIDGFIKGHGYGPSYREIMRALDYKSVSTVAVHINGLIKKGHLRKRDHSARSLELTNNHADVQPQQQKVSKTQEKWLIDAITARFNDIEGARASAAELDSLFVLVGALQVLGFVDAATSFKPRLAKLKQQIDASGK